MFVLVTRECTYIFVIYLILILLEHHSGSPQLPHWRRDESEERVLDQRRNQSQERTPGPPSASSSPRQTRSRRHQSQERILGWIRNQSQEKTPGPPSASSSPRQTRSRRHQSQERILGWIRNQSQERILGWRRNQSQERILGWRRNQSQKRISGSPSTKSIAIGMYVWANLYSSFVSCEIIWAMVYQFTCSRCGCA